MVLSHLDWEQLPGPPRRRLRRPEDSEPPRGRHVRVGNGLLRPRGDVRLSPADVDAGLRHEFGAPHLRPSLLLLPHARGRLHGVVHRPVLPRLRNHAAPPREPLPAGLSAHRSHWSYDPGHAARERIRRHRGRRRGHVGPREPRAVRDPVHVHRSRGPGPHAHPQQGSHRPEAGDPDDRRHRDPRDGRGVVRVPTNLRGPVSASLSHDYGIRDGRPLRGRGLALSDVRGDASKRGTGRGAAAFRPEGRSRLRDSRTEAAAGRSSRSPKRSDSGRWAS